MNDDAKKDPQTGIEMIGIKTRKRKACDVYALVPFGFTDEKAITIDGNIVLFENYECANLFYSQKEVYRVELGAIDVDKRFICDVPEALRMIRYEKIEKYNTILNLINTLDDLIQAQNIKYPVRYQKMLYKFADHLTFNTDLDGYFNKIKTSRNDIVTAVKWCIENIFKNSIYITKYRINLGKS